MKEKNKYNPENICSNRRENNLQFEVQLSCTDISYMAFIFSVIVHYHYSLLHSPVHI